MAERFEAQARTVTVLTLLSRISGLARDAVLSRVFGAGPLMDAFFFAFMIPNLFRRLFGEGALAAAFLPAYTRLHRDDPRRAAQLATLIIGLLAVGLGILVVAGELLLLAWSSAAPQHDLTARLSMIMLPYMPMVCVVAIMGAMLQVHGRFGPPAAAPVVLNLAVVLAALGTGAIWTDGDATRRITAVALAVLLAGVIQVIWSAWALGRGHFARHPTEARAPAARVARAALPMVVGLGALQINTFLDGLIASYPATIGPTIMGVDYPLEPGAMAAVSFAQRLYQFPLGVFGIAVATAIFPALARVTGDPDGFAATLRRGLRLVLFIGLPASAGLFMVRQPLTEAILRGGRFGADDAERVGRVLMGYAPAIWAYSMTQVLTRGFYALDDARRAVRVAVAMVGLNLLLNCLLIWTDLREAGLAWSTAACASIQGIILLLMLQRRVGRLVDGPVAASWTRTALLTAVMCVALHLARSWMGPAGSWGGIVLELSLLVALGAAVVGGGAFLLRCPELRWALGRHTP